MFGVIPPNADFKTLKNKKEPKVDLLKKWLQKNGYTVTNDSNVFYKNIDKIKAKNPKLAEKLRRGKKNAMLAHQLATILTNTPF